MSAGSERAAVAAELETPAAQADASAYATRWLRSPLRRKNLAPGALAVLAAAVVVILAARPTSASLRVGLPLVAAGLALRLWAAGHLVKTRELATDGPYRFLRHPLYAGALLIAVGVLGMAGPPLAVLGIPAALGVFFLSYLPRKESRESRRLEERHGAAFRRYRRAVPRLFPRLRGWQPTAGARDAGWSFARLVENDELGVLLGVGMLAAAVVLRA